MNRTLKQTLLALMALGLTAACESKTASLAPHQTASIEWDVVMASDGVAHAPRNAGLIFMR